MARSRRTQTPPREKVTLDQLREILARYDLAEPDLTHLRQAAPPPDGPETLTGVRFNLPTVNLPPEAMFPSGGHVVIEMATSLVDMLGKAEATGRAPFRKGRSADAALNSAIVRLHDELLADKTRRTWRQVREALAMLNPNWHFRHPATKAEHRKADDAVRRRYATATKPTC